jgi:anti-sigma factor (TIGR02949 family)
MTFLLTCKEFLADLNDYLDGCCGVDIRMKLEKHVTECPNCWVVYDTTKRTLKVYKGMEPQEIPEHIKSRLMAALEQKMAAQQRKQQAEDASQKSSQQGKGL